MHMHSQQVFSRISSQHLSAIAFKREKLEQFCANLDVYAFICNYIHSAPHWSKSCEYCDLCYVFPNPNIYVNPFIHQIPPLIHNNRVLPEPRGFNSIPL